MDTLKIQARSLCQVGRISHSTTRQNSIPSQCWQSAHSHRCLCILLGADWLSYNPPQRIWPEDADQTTIYEIRTGRSESPMGRTQRMGMAPHPLLPTSGCLDQKPAVDMASHGIPLQSLAPLTTVLLAWMSPITGTEESRSRSTPASFMSSNRYSDSEPETSIKGMHRIFDLDTPDPQTAM